MKSSWLTLPNCITLIRIALTPIIILCIIQQVWLTATILMAIAAISDFADGFVARKMNQQTAFGAILDSLADKILMIALLITILMLNIPELPRWFCLLILGKETLVLAISSILITHKVIYTITPLLLGKISMAAQMIFIVWFLFAKSMGFYIPKTLTALVASLAIAVLVFYAIAIKKLVYKT